MHLKFFINKMICFWLNYENALQYILLYEYIGNEFWLVGGFVWGFFFFFFACLFGIYEI